MTHPLLTALLRSRIISASRPRMWQLRCRATSVSCYCAIRSGSPTCFCASRRASTPRPLPLWRPGRRWSPVTRANRARSLTLPRRNSRLADESCYLATARLKLGNLRIPNVLVSADDVSKGKPDPEPYLTGARLLGVNPKDCLVIEDAPAGIRAAHAGGMKAIGITSTYPASGLQESDAVIQTLSQIKVESVGGKLRVTVS